jgi:Ca2+-binding RTX toxin-like protein
MAVFNVPTTIATNVVGTNADDQIFSIVDPFVASTGGNQNLFGGLGNDTYILGNVAPGAVGDVVFEMFGEGIDTVVLFTNINAGYTLVNNVENLIGRRFTATAAAAWTGNSLTGNQLNNLITVDDGPFGLGGVSETIDGGLGNDTMAAGHGNDLYRVDSALDIITESNTAVLGGILTNGVINGVVQAGFVDTVETVVSYTLGLNLENLTLLGTPPNLNFNGTGNLLPNLITGNAGNNVLDGLEGSDTLFGGGGNDTMRGGGGNDTLDAVAATSIGGVAGNITLDGGAGDDLYKVDSALDVIVADAGGVDMVHFTSGATFNTFTLPLFIEHAMNMTAGQSVTFTGNALDNNLYGNTVADTLTGNDGNDILDGGGGIDSLTGGKGNDVYVLDQIGDLVTAEKPLEGIDTIYVTLLANQTYTLPTNFERLFLTGAATPVSGIGNADNNVIGGNNGANTLLGLAGNDNINGRDGNDLIAGGLGNDTLDGDLGNDSISGAQGNDLIFAGAGDDTLEGGDGADTLDGGTGADSMSGGAGNDVYFVDHLVPGNPTVRDIVFELPGLAGGIDVVNSTVSIDLLFANVENLNLTGTANINGIGNGLLNVINGNIGANVLDAGRDVGALPLNDTLVGGLGNDTYIIYGPNDIVTEVPNVLIPGIPPVLAPGFLDTVIYRGTATYTLAANVEILTLDVGLGNVNALGNTLDNTITGSAGTNLLDGSGGNDAIFGGAGNDTLLGNIGNDFLDGQLGADSMVGGAGDDSYVVTSAGDIVDELTGGTGNDTVISHLRDINIDSTFNANMKGLIEHVTLGGGALNATGNALGNILRGNASQNVLTGGMGNDTFFADLSDQIIEGSALTGGIDTVNMDVGTVGGGTITVRNGTAPIFIPSGQLWNVENVTLLGTASWNVIVERQLATATQVNILVGNDGNNILDGAGGADSMTGGKGNDTYYTDNAADKTVELAGPGSGIDTVFSTVAWILQPETENLYLIGTGILPVAGTGNLLDNFIRGNGAANALSGLAGNDTLDGGGGNDTMNGADGNDTYWVDTLFDVVTDTTGTDTVISTIAGPAGYNLTAAATVENLVLFNGWAVAPGIMNGTGNLLDNRITGNVSYNTLDGGGGSDTLDFSIVGTFSANDSAIGGLGTDTLANDTLLADITNLNIVAQLDEIETAILRAEGGFNGTIDFGALGGNGWEDLRAVNFTGSAGRTLTVDGTPNTGFVNNAPSGTPLVFGLTDYDGAGVTINGDNVSGSTDVLNLAIRDSGLNTTLTTAGWETIRINHQPSADTSFANNTLNLSGLTVSPNDTVIEVTGSGGGQLTLDALSQTALTGGSAFARDLQITVLNYADRLQIQQSSGITTDAVQVNVRDSSFWLDMGGGGAAERDFDTMEIFALAPLAPATVNTSFVHLNELSGRMGGTLSVGGAANSVLVIDGIKAGTISASTFGGSSLFLTAESTAAGTWTGPTSGAVIFSFVGGGGADTFNFNTAGMIDGLDLVDGGPGADTVNVNVVGMGVTGTAMSGGLHLANVETVNMTNTGGTAVIDAAMMSGNVVMAGGAFTSITIHGLAGNFSGASINGDVTIYSRAAGGQIFNTFGTGTYTLFGSPGDGVPGDTFTFGSTLDSADFVQAFDFSTTVSDTLTATLGGATYAPTILGVERIDLSGTGTNTFDALNVVGTHTWNLVGTQNLTLDNLNWSPNAAGHMLVDGTFSTDLTGTLVVNGSDGNDSIIGGTGANTLNGAEGADTLVGAGVGDSLTGGGGNDSLFGGGGVDSLYGGDGNDTFNISTNDASAVDNVDGGPGTSDALDYSSVGTAVTVDLDAGTGSTGTTGLDTFTGIERVIGGSGADTFTGSNAYTLNQDSTDYAETYQGRGGNDSINGGGTENGYVDLTDYNTSVNPVGVNLGAGNYTLVSGGLTVNAGTARDLGAATHGTDTLVNIDGAIGSSGNDVLVGGSTSRAFNGSLFEVWRGLGGNDTIAGNVNALSDAVVAASTGTVDTTDFDMADYSFDPAGVVVDLRLGTAQDGFGGMDLLFDITHVRGSLFDDILVGGNAGNNAFEAFEGMGGDDHIDGGSGFDVARYSRATEAINASLLTGVVQGGVDSLINVEGIDGGDFNDTMVGSATLLVTERFSGMKGNDSIDGGLGNDMADYLNDPAAVTVTLGAPGTATDGWGDTDTLLGIEDVRGSQFSDTITGDGLNNRLDGGRNTGGGVFGNDTLTGGVGSDTFVFNTTLDVTYNVDTLTDFTPGTDKIELDDAIFADLAGGVAAGNLAQGAGATAADGDDYLVYDSTTGFLYYDDDGNIGPAAVQFAVLPTGLTLAAADFVVV